MISVIIPVYNSAPFLSPMLDSVLNQSYRDIEMILINDGSKDNSSEICHSYAEKHTCVKVYDCENRGASAARNFGIEQACGEFIWFMDSDDTLSKDALQTAVSAQQQYDADVVIGGMNFCFEKEGKTVSKTVEQAFAFSASHLKEHYKELFGKNYISSLCNKLIRRSIVADHHIRMIESLLMYEDYIFCMDLLMKCNRIACVGNVFYEYRLRSSESLSHKYKPNAADMFRILKKKIAGYIDAFSHADTSVDECLNNLMIYLAYECVKNESRAKANPRRKIKELLEDKDFCEAMEEFNGYTLRLRAVRMMMKHKMVLPLSLYLKWYHRKNT